MRKTKLTFRIDILKLLAALIMIYLIVRGYFPTWFFWAYLLTELGGIVFKKDIYI